MHNHWKKLTLVLLLAVGAGILGTNHSTENCIPSNDLYIPANLKSVPVVSEDQFNRVIDEVEEVYKPIFVEKYEAELKVERAWDDGTVNAYAYRKGSDWYVKMFGGLARHEEATEDGFMAVICHEIGHHVGGAPVKTSWWGGTTWAANEGQSDYFATAKCLKKVYELQMEKTYKIFDEAKSEEELYLKEKCEETYDLVEEEAICYRTALAGKSLGSLLASLRDKKIDVKIKDEAVVTKTDHTHPAGQCRFDTYFEGALCNKDHHEFPDKEDASAGYCMRADGYKVGVRPLCWYKPEVIEEEEESKK